MADGQVNGQAVILPDGEISWDGADAFSTDLNANPQYPVRRASVGTGIGFTGLRRSSGVILEEDLPAARGWLGRKLIKEMADNDSTVIASMWVIDLALRQVEFQVQPADAPGGEDVAAFVESCLYDMADTFEELISAAATMVPHGWSWLEIVYKDRNGPDAVPYPSRHTDGKLGWAEWAVRSQDSQQSWLYPEDAPDSAQAGQFPPDRIIAMTQQDPNRGTVATIPERRSLHFRTSANGNNPEGRSLVRGAVRPYLIKRRIEELEAIGAERDLAGMPYFKVPAAILGSNATPAQKALAQHCRDVVTQVRRNESDGLLLPTQYDPETGKDLYEFGLIQSPGDRQFDTNGIINRLRQEMAMTMLTDVILLGHEKVGSFALGDVKVDLFSAGMDALVGIILAEINAKAISALVRLNGWKQELTPELVATNVDKLDVATVVDALAKAGQAGIVLDGEEIAEWLRGRLGLPQAAPEEDDAASVAARQALETASPADPAAKGADAARTAQSLYLASAGNVILSVEEARRMVRDAGAPLDDEIPDDVLLAVAAKLAQQTGAAVSGVAPAVTGSAPADTTGTPATPATSPPAEPGAPPATAGSPAPGEANVAAVTETPA